MAASFDATPRVEAHDHLTVRIAWSIRSSMRHQNLAAAEPGFLRIGFLRIDVGHPMARRSVALICPAGACRIGVAFDAERVQPRVAVSSIGLEFAGEGYAGVFRNVPQRR